MIVTLELLNIWLAAPSETEHLEFKESKAQYDSTKLFKNCVALAIDNGGNHAHLDFIWSP